MPVKKSKLNTVAVGERTICNGAVVLFKRNNSKRWQARIRRNIGEWITVSTKQTEIEKAITVAEERYRDIQYAQRTGKIDVTRKFSSICQLCKKELLNKSERTGKELPKNLVQVIDKYIEPILGNYMCHNIDTEALRLFSEKRAAMIGHQPAKSTIATHNTALNYLFKAAKEKNFIEFIPKTINDGVEGKRRPYFNDDEIQALYLNMHRYLQHSEKLLNNITGRNGLDTIKQKSYWMREILHDMIPILVNTGMRPGREILNLKWNNLSIIEQNGKESIKFSLPHSKTIRRVVIGYEPTAVIDNECEYLQGDRDTNRTLGCWTPLKKIQSRFEDLKDLTFEQLFRVDEYIFRYPNGERAVQEQMAKSFKRLLKWSTYKGVKEGLLKDSFGEERTLYSLRHTYASQRRKEGISFDDLSVQMGTSVKMLEQHYSHFTVSDNPNKFAGHEKRDEEQRLKQQYNNSDLIKSLVEKNSEQSKRIEELLEQQSVLMRKLVDDNCEE